MGVGWGGTERGDGGDKEKVDIMRRGDGGRTVRESEGRVGARWRERESIPRGVLTRIEGEGQRRQRKEKFGETEGC